MILAHISDLHIAVGTPETSLVRPDANARAARLFEHLSSWQPRIDLVAISGDLCDTGTLEDYAFLLDLLNALPMPWVVVPGNHDRRGAMRTVFSNLPFVDDQSLSYIYCDKDVRVVALDSTVPGAPQGRLGPKDLTWLETSLARPFDGPTFVMLHHPPCSTRMGMADKAILMEGADTLKALLDAQPQPVTILCGHMHRPFETRFGKSRVFAGGSTAFEFQFVPDTTVEPAITREPYGFQLHLLQPAVSPAEASHVVHRITPQF